MLEKTSPNLNKAVTFEKQNDNTQKPRVNFQKDKTDAELISELHQEIANLQGIIEELNTEIDLLVNPPKLTLRQKLSPKVFFPFLIDNIKENMLGYLISGVLAGSVASGIEVIMKARSLDDIKNITTVMQEQALKEVQDSIDEKTVMINSRIETIETASNQLESSQSATLKEVLGRTKATLNDTKDKVVGTEEEAKKEAPKPNQPPAEAPKETPAATESRSKNKK